MLELIRCQLAIVNPADPDNLSTAEGAWLCQMLTLHCYVVLSLQNVVVM